MTVNRFKGGDMTQAQKILARLVESPATSRDLNNICFRFSARIHELRKEGYVIRSERIKDGLFRFTLEGEPDGKSFEPVGEILGVDVLSHPDAREQATLISVAPAKPTQNWG
jgi:hypothetical protein